MTAHNEHVRADEERARHPAYNGRHALRDWN